VVEGGPLVTSQGSLLRWTAPDGRWTEPDLHLFAQDGHRYEIADGCLHVTPPLDEVHESVVRALVTTLRGAAPDGWWVCARLGIETGGSNLIPDLTVLRPQSSGAVWSCPADVALVVEVESAESARYDRLLKPSLYAQAKIQNLWRIDRDARAHIYTLAEDEYEHRQTIAGPDLAQLKDPFPVRLAPSTWSCHLTTAKTTAG
jgi:Uma2 family endonuclease